MTVPATTVTPSGLVLLEAIRDGRALRPPAAALLDLDLLEVAEGRTLFGFEPAEAYLNPAGAVHGGVLAAVADFAVATAVISASAPGADVVTTNLDVTFIRGVALGTGRLLCEGRLVHLGRTLAHADAILSDGQGRLYLRATATLRVRTAAPPAPAPPG